jgi:hypothetical protein
VPDLPQRGYEPAALEAGDLHVLPRRRAAQRAAEHTRLEAARVDRLLAGRKDDKDGLKLPLTDDRRIWCGTCHLFHDPSLGEDWLATGWVPPQTGLPEAVRQGATTKWDAIAAAHDAKGVGASFAEKGTRQLRLPVSDGSLCRQCHRSLP